MSNRRQRRPEASRPRRRDKRWLAPVAWFARACLRLLFRSDRHRPVRRRRRPFARAGFTLPTTTIVLLVITLLLSAMLLRTGERTLDVSREIESTRIYNNATPAIDRAKAKLEFLFERDHRFPAGIASGRYIDSMLRNSNLDDGGNGDDTLATPLADDPYTLPDETRLDIGGTNGTEPDNAWEYQTDLDGDGEPETVRYSIVLFAENGDVNSSDSAEVKAANLVTRNDPVQLLEAAGLTRGCPFDGLSLESDWYVANAATLRKNFQVDAVVESGNDLAGSVTTLEFQQDRQLDRLNRWGAWYRYDMEIFPGQNELVWNGAMHTEANMLVGFRDGLSTYYLLSNPRSCFYQEGASEITLNEERDENGDLTFQGQIFMADGTANTPNSWNGTSLFHLFPGEGISPREDEDPEAAGANNPPYVVTMNSDSDMVDNSQANTPYDLSLNPIPVFTEDRSVPRSENTNAEARADDWGSGETELLTRRIYNQTQRRPYVDDTHRADDWTCPGLVDT